LVYDELLRGYRFSRLHDAAASLVRTPWATERIQRLTDALFEHGTLSGEEIYAVVSTPRSWKNTGKPG
jgi:hypothetical protein